MEFNLKEFQNVFTQLFLSKESYNIIMKSGYNYNYLKNDKLTKTIYIYGSKDFIKTFFDKIVNFKSVKLINIK